MSKYRRAAKIDSNQREIVKTLRLIPGVSVEVGHDDILVGYGASTYWYEIKARSAVSQKTGKVMISSIKDSQKKLLSEFKGHYRIVSSADEIIEEIVRGGS